MPGQAQPAEVCLRSRESGPGKTGVLLLLMFVGPFIWVLQTDPPRTELGVRALQIVTGMCVGGAVLCWYASERWCDRGRGFLRRQFRYLGVPVAWRSIPLDTITGVEIRLEALWGDHGDLETPRLALVVRHQVIVHHGGGAFRFRKGECEADEPMDGMRLLAWMWSREELEFLWEALRLAELTKSAVTTVGQAWDGVDAARVSREEIERRARPFVRSR